MTKNKYTRNDLKLITHDALALFGVDVKSIELKIANDQYQMIIHCVLFPDLVKREMKISLSLEIGVLKDVSLADKVLSAFSSTLNVMLDSYDDMLSDDLILLNNNDYLDELTDKDNEKDFANTFVIHDYFEFEHEFKKRLEKLNYDINNDLFLRKAEKPSLYNDKCEKPSLADKALANDFSVFARDSWIHDHAGIVPDAEHAALNLSNYKNFVLYLIDHDGEVKLDYDTDDLIELQNSVLRGFHIK